MNETRGQSPYEAVMYLIWSSVAQALLPGKQNQRMNPRRNKQRSVILAKIREASQIGTASQTLTLPDHLDEDLRVTIQAARGALIDASSELKDMDQLVLNTCIGAVNKIVAEIQSTRSKSSSNSDAEDDHASEVFMGFDVTGDINPNLHEKILHAA